jgi:SagB-type dehydrogenase family enzyme
MKKLLTLALMMMLSTSMMAQSVQQLPAPKFDKKSSSMSLVDVLQKRESVREYAADPLTDQELSNILWGACGINRPESKRLTAPSAVNAQDIIVYVCRADGAWRYDAQQNTLTRITELDLRKAVAGRQPFAANAPVCLLLVSDLSKLRGNREYGAMDAGYVSENIYLICTAMGLKTVARAMMERDALVRELGLNDSQVPMLNHPIGR